MMQALGIDIEWGSWVLGDLHDVLCKVTDIVSASSQVLRVELTPPWENGDLPEVRIVVTDIDTCDDMGSDVRHGEHAVVFEDAPDSGYGWAARLAGFRLTVTVPVMNR
ncbi:hypothetical protein [Nocardioides bruguierae]|uniref:hypothetical protein n=1 Tax=Nocardioides bruguierae TaxID=2945102 RepID=UPI0020218FCC|nr:hypothetical protein [Nocardioides bruguierae]MCL8026045.1 hypothetical protein [Nocardioides bruguierae]